jgi:hypothetical protein
MKKLHPQEEKIMRAIRDSVVFDPLISITKLRDVLFDKNIRTATNEPLDWDYVKKLREKLHRQGIENVNRQQVVERVAEMKERCRVIYEQLIRIAFYTEDMKKDGMPPPSPRDRISALREMSKIDLAIFGVEMDAGIYERHLGTLELDKRNKPLPVEARELIRQAMINWGMVPKELPEPHGNQNNTNQQPIVPKR